jgi:hypothetical protein
MGGGPLPSRDRGHSKSGCVLDFRTRLKVFMDRSGRFNFWRVLVLTRAITPQG